jgi:hypothetical protein
MKLKCIVEVMHDETEEIVRSHDFGNDMRKAERIRDGINMQINHNEYSVFITSFEDKQ